MSWGSRHGSCQPSRLQNSTIRPSGTEADCTAQLQMGVLAGIEAIDSDLEMGATIRDPGFLQEAQPLAVSR